MARKAQMFIVTTLFMIGLIFTVQQLIFQYTALDLSAPFRENSIYLLRNTKDVINATIRSTPDCADFSAKMKELKDFLDRRVPYGGYSLAIDYKLNCSKWTNAAPQPSPLNVTLQIVGKTSETASRVYLYHI
jgi:hypothetical protein